MVVRKACDVIMSGRRYVRNAIERGVFVERSGSGFSVFAVLCVDVVFESLDSFVCWLVILLSSTAKYFQGSFIRCSVLLNREVICLAQESLVDVDISKYLVSMRELPKRELVVFECLLSEACSVVAVLLKDSAYRSLNVKFLCYNNAHLPLVSIEVEFAVLV